MRLMPDTGRVPPQSAGLLVWRRSPDLQVLLAHPGGPFYARKDDGVWTLPKGEVDEGEDLLTAAYREFQEELGLPAPAGEPVPLGQVRQRSGKIVTAWAMEGDVDVDAVVPGLFEMPWRGRLQSFPEIDRAAWFGLPAAREKLLTAQHPFLDRLSELPG
jgi:predicted NUDIX family NTP pyrophosphohydrolase